MATQRRRRGLELVNCVPLLTICLLSDLFPSSSGQESASTITNSLSPDYLPTGSRALAETFNSTTNSARSFERSDTIEATTTKETWTTTSFSSVPDTSQDTYNDAVSSSTRQSSAPIYSPTLSTLIDNSTRQEQTLTTIDHSVCRQISSSNTSWIRNATCYEFVSQRITWVAAEERCESSGGYLVVIRDIATQQFIEQILEDLGLHEESVWIGLSDKNTEGRWEWSDGEVLGRGFTNWAEGEPNADSWIYANDCVQIRTDVSHKWHAHSCDNFFYLYPFICQYDPVKPTTTEETRTTTAFSSVPDTSQDTYKEAISSSTRQSPDLYTTSQSNDTVVVTTAIEMSSPRPTLPTKVDASPYSHMVTHGASDRIELTTAATVAQKVCPQLRSDNPVRLQGGVCYEFVITYTRNWESAENFCSRNGGHLVAIRDNVTQQLIEQTLEHLGWGRNRGVWIGLRDHNTEGTWEWSTGELLGDGFSNWASGQPSGGWFEEDCAQIRLDDNYKWHDYNCVKWTTAYRFICQYDLVNDTLLPGSSSPELSTTESVAFSTHETVTSPSTASITTTSAPPSTETEELIFTTRAMEVTTESGVTATNTLAAEPFTNMSGSTAVETAMMNSTTETTTESHVTSPWLSTVQTDIVATTSSAKLPSNGSSVERECNGSNSRQRGATCYEFMHTEKTWVAAETGCLNNGGHLVAISDNATQQFIEEALEDFGWGSAPGVWIGLNDRTTEEVWKWSSGEALGNGFTNWAAGEPNDHLWSEDCVQMVPSDNFLWHDYPCHNKWLVSYEYKSICQYAAAQKSLTTLSSIVHKSSTEKESTSVVLSTINTTESLQPNATGSTRNATFGLSTAGLETTTEAEQLTTTARSQEFATVTITAYLTTSAEDEELTKTTTPAHEKGRESGLSDETVGLIVGSVIGGLVLILVVIAIVVFVRKKRSSKADFPMVYANPAYNGN